MIPCPSCERFVRGSSSECPFCGAALRDGPSPAGAFAGILLGLTLVACGSKEPSAEEGGSSTASSTTAATDDPSATSSTSGQITSLDGEESFADVAAYAGPDVDSITDSVGDTDPTGTGTSTGTGTGTGTGTETGTGTDTGTDTGGSGSGSSGG